LDASALVINGRVPASLNDHADHLAFELAIHGHRVVVDSGAYEPEGEVSSDYFQSALAHNVLLVDHGRASFGGRSHASADARVAFAAMDGSQLQLSTAHPSRLAETLDEGDGFTGLRLPGESFAQKGLRHRRAWFCLDNRGWVILDSLEGPGAHSILSLLHFYPTFEVELADHRATARSRALTVNVIPLGQAQPNLTASRGDDPSFPGWYAPDFGVKYASSVLALGWTNVEMPWAGGYLILPGGQPDFHPQLTAIGSRTVLLELSGKHYSLPTG
jgi:Heparinase II/III-like protein